MNSWSVADETARILSHFGVKDIFLLPGGGCMYLVDAVHRNTNLTPRIMMHEQSLGIAAEAYAQYQNKISVVLVTTGPGGTNAITPCAAAWTDSTPMLFISGQVKTSDSREHYSVRQLGFQEVPIAKIVEPITKKAKKLVVEDDISLVLNELLETAISGRPGPVWLDIPLDIQNAPYLNSMILDGFKRTSTSIRENGSLSKLMTNSDFEKIREKICSAKKPLILVGNGVRLSNCIQEVVRFARDSSIPILLTWKMIDILDECDPLNAGRPGSILQPWSNLLQEESDFILSLGARLDTGQTAYNLALFGKNASKMIVDIDARELAKFLEYPSYEVFEQDVSTFVDGLIYSFSEVEAPACWNSWVKHVLDTKARHVKDFYYRKSPDQGVNLYNFIRVLSDNLSNEAIVVPGSSGACSEVVMQAFQVKEGQRVLNSEGLGSMGFGISAAYGVYVASEGKQIVCIDGDGGFQMNVQELATVDLHATGIIFFVLNNNGYGSIKSTQDKYFSGRRLGVDPTTGLALINLHRTAECFNFNYVKIESEVNMQAQIKQILTSNSNALVEIMISPDHITSPRVSLLKDNLGNFLPSDMSIFQ